MKKKKLRNMVIRPHSKPYSSTTPDLFFKRSEMSSFPTNNLVLSQAFLVNKNQISSDSFTKKISEIMNQYKYESHEKDENKGDISNLFLRTGRNSYKKEKEDILRIIHKSRQLNKSQSTPSILKTKNSNESIVKSHENGELSEDRRIKFDFIEENFKNPIQAYNVVQKNKVIYQSMVQNYELFEKSKYHQIFKKLNFVVDNNFNQKKRKYLQPPKIKISTKIPKIIDTSWFNPQRDDEIMKDFPNQSKNESSNHLSSLLLEQKKDSNKIIPNILLLTKFIYPNHLFPESRDQFVFAHESTDILLCGGNVSNKSNELWRFNPLLNQWSKLIINSITPEPRYGHTGILHNNKLIIFGGKLLNLPILGDVDIFNLDILSWSSPALMTYSKLKLRRNHIACCIGNQMFIHGGIDEDGNYLSDCYLLNLNPLKWIACSINEDTPSPTLAFHKCCLVLQEDLRVNPKLNIYRLPEVGIKRNLNDNIRERGLYIFGGKESESGPVISDLFILRIGRRPLEWAKLRTVGKGPSPRFSSSINYYEEGNCIIIHGGRNDKTSQNLALNDTYILELFNLNWIRVDYYFEVENMSMPNRCAHESVIYDHNLIIFGGMNSENMVGSLLCIIELDSNKKCLHKKEELNADKIMKKYNSHRRKKGKYN